MICYDWFILYYYTYGEILFEFLKKVTTSEDKEEFNDLPHLVALLMVEVSRVDYDIQEIDIEKSCESISKLTKISKEEAKLLMTDKIKETNRNVSYYQITSKLNKLLDYEEKVSLVKELWVVAHSDQNLDKYEDHLIRKIASLLYVNHADNILARNSSKNA